MENLHPTGCQCLTCCPPQPQTTQEDLNQDLDYFLTYSNPPHHQNIPTTEYYQPPDNLGLHYPYINPYPDYQFNQLPENPANLPLPNQSLMNLGGTETYTYTNMSTPVSTPYNPPQDQPSTSSGITDGGRRSKKTCAHCSKVFAHTGDYRKHMRKHTKEKPYQCTRCGKYFAHTSNLHRHVRSHEGVRPHKCELCGKEFGRKDKLDSHKKCSKSCRDKKPDRQ